MSYKVTGDSAKLTERVSQPSEVQQVICSAESGELRNHVFLEAQELEGRASLLVDTGAAVSVIKIGKLKPGLMISSQTILLHGITRQEMETLGKVIIFLCNGPERLGHEFHVVQNDFLCVDGILGSDFLEARYFGAKMDIGKYLLSNGVQWKLHRAPIPVQGNSDSDEAEDTEVESSASSMVGASHLSEIGSFRFGIRIRVAELRIQQLW
uniref:Retropepsins domain-containing protein n=1 Tax=Bracon brevicornis TaxID=1563983 RepID=A0A6V7KTS6_9HYME